MAGGEQVKAPGIKKPDPEAALTSAAAAAVARAS
jgi:hypothetical protein